jgi:hypothetical protein
MLPRPADADHVIAHSGSFRSFLACSLVSMEPRYTTNF